jgi:stage III sporulation protein AG
VAAPGEGGGGRRRWLPEIGSLRRPEWKTAAWMAALLGAGLILLLQRPAAAPARGAGDPGAPSAAAPAGPLQAEEAALSAELSAALGRIAGAGTVSVQVHLQSGGRTQYATDEQDSDAVTSDEGSGAGAQTTTQTTKSTQVVMASSGAPVVADVGAPVVSGVLVVASGAANPVVAEELAEAAQALSGAPLYRITVLPGLGG